MSAVAATEYAPHAELHLVTASEAGLAESEMYRWMLWLGMPSLAAAIFMGAVFATDSMWLISGAIAAVLGLVGVLIWLALSTCTLD